MNVKNIKSFVEFYESLGISTFITKLQRSSNTRSNSIYLEKDNPIIINENSIKDKIDSAISVSDTSIEQAIAMLALTEKVVVEGAGAVGLAAIIENQKKFKNKNVGIILCGGNIDSKILSSILHPFTITDSLECKLFIYKTCTIFYLNIKTCASNPRQYKIISSRRILYSNTN